MDPPGLPIDLLRKGIDVGRFEFAEGAVFEDLVDDRVGVLETLEHILIDGVAGLGLAPGRQLQLFEEERRNLLGGVDIELAADERVDILLALPETRADLLGEIMQVGDVDGDPGALHVHEHGDERHLDFPKQRVLPLVGDLWGKQVGEHPGRLDIAAGVLGDLLGGNDVHRQLLAAVADQRLDLGHLHPEASERQILEAERRLAEEIGGDHRVELEPPDREAGTLEHLQVVLAVVGDRAVRGVGEDRAQHPADIVERHAAEAGVGDRDVGAFARGDCDRDADEARDHRVDGGRLDVDRVPRRGGDAGGERLQLRDGGDEGALRRRAFHSGSGSRRVRRRGLRRRRRRLGQLVHEGAELQIAEERDRSLAIVGGDVRPLGVEGDLEITDDRRQCLRGAGDVDVLGQRLLRPRRCHLRDAGQNRLQIAELGDQVGGGLFADAGDAGNVVRRVAHQRLVVGNQLRREAVALVDGIAVVDAEITEAFDAGEHRDDMVVDELQQVAVPGDDDHLVAVAGAGAGEAADDIVGLVPGPLVDRDVEGIDQLADAPDLLDKVGWGLGARRLVAVEGLVAKGAAAFERHRDVLGVVRLDDVEEHRREAEDGVRLLALLGHHRCGDGVVGAEEETEAIDQHQTRPHGAMIIRHDAPPGASVPACSIEG